MAYQVVLQDGHSGREWLLRLVYQGDQYGLRDCIQHTGPQPLVEFYDRANLPKVRAEWERGWSMWCNLRGCPTDHHAEAGYRAAAECNESGGNRPTVAEWEEVFEDDPEARGQFVSRYQVTTFLTHSGALCLMGHEPAWNVSSDLVRQAQRACTEWLARRWQ